VSDKKIEDREKLETLRHSAAHLMAEAVQQLFPEAKFGIGPTIEDGFYYDFELSRPLTSEDLPVIEAKMKELMSKNEPFIRTEVTVEEARKLFSSQPYKLELIQEFADEKLTTYRQGSFLDLCRGPHIASAREIKAFKLLSIAGAYWRGSENNPMLQRIYGTAFFTETELKSHLDRIAEAAKRDHRKLGRELDLFSMHEEIGPGLTNWHPKGAIIRLAIEDFWRREHLRRGYDIVYTPHIARSDLWKTSGHWEMYRENLYSPMDVEGMEYLIKPMNCPFHIMMYKSQLRSYRDLPLRWAELGTVYRYERSGVLHGLTRVRGFTQDDAHIFCRPDQLEEEIKGVLELAKYMLRTFGFEDYSVKLSTRPEKYAGSLEIWEVATNTLKQALEGLSIPYEIDPGEGVFYGPKIDISLRDALGHSWQGPTTQVDFNLPQRFDVNFIGEDGKEHQVVMVHRTVLGSMERFFGCLIEHYAGAFPVWLSPVQAIIIPIADRHLEYARKVQAQLRGEDLRIKIDDRKERMNLKIRDAQLQKIPFMLVVGDKEEKENSVSLRERGGVDFGAVSLSDVLMILQHVIKDRSRDYKDYVVGILSK